MDLAEQQREFFQLLDGNHNEQVYQSFLERNTRFIPREFEQNHGIHLSLVLRKLSLGADYKTDFFYFSKSSDDWNAVFVDIERPSSRFFRDNTNDLHPDFHKALEQISRWKGWFFSEENRKTFLSMVRPIHVPYHMAGNPTFYKYVLVYGRRVEYAGNEHRRHLVKSKEADDFKVITFDSLAEALPKKYDLTIGSRHNEFIDVLTDAITDPSLYAWVEPTQLRVSRSLRDMLRDPPPSTVTHVTFVEGKMVNKLVQVAPLVRVRD